MQTALEVEEKKRGSDELIALLGKDRDVQKLLAKKVVQLGLKDKLKDLLK